MISEVSSNLNDSVILRRRCAHGSPRPGPAPGLTLLCSMSWKSTSFTDSTWSPSCSPALCASESGITCGGVTAAVTPGAAAPSPRCPPGAGPCWTTNTSRRWRELRKRRRSVRSPPGERQTPVWRRALRRRTASPRSGRAPQRPGSGTGPRGGRTEGRTHLGDEDPQLRGFSSADVEAQLREKPAVESQPSASP